MEFIWKCLLLIIFFYVPSDTRDYGSYHAEILSIENIPTKRNDISFDFYLQQISINEVRLQGTLNLNKDFKFSMNTLEITPRYANALKKSTVPLILLNACTRHMTTFLNYLVPKRKLNLKDCMLPKGTYTLESYDVLKVLKEKKPKLAYGEFKLISKFLDDANEEIFGFIIYFEATNEDYYRLSQGNQQTLEDENLDEGDFYCHGSDTDFQGSRPCVRLNPPESLP